MVLVGFFRNYFIYKNFLTKTNTITMYFELNIFNNNVKGNVYEQVHSQKYCRLLTTREGVPLKISLAVSSMLYYGSVGPVQSKDCYFCLHILFWHCFVVFHQKKNKKNVLSFLFLFFGEVSNFCNRILTNQKLEQVVRSCQ